MAPGRHAVGCCQDTLSVLDYLAPPCVRSLVLYASSHALKGNSLHPLSSCSALFITFGLGQLPA